MTERWEAGAIELLHHHFEGQELDIPYAEKTLEYINYRKSEVAVGAGWEHHRGY